MTAIPLTRSSVQHAPSPTQRRRGPRRVALPLIRILVYAPGSEDGRHGLVLARQVCRSLPDAGVLVVTDGVDDAPLLPSAVQWSRLPDLRTANPERPLALEHMKHQRRKHLNTLFDRFRPMILVAASEAAPPEELHDLLERATAFGGTTIFTPPSAHSTFDADDRRRKDCAVCEETLAAIVEEARQQLES